ncbi:type II secretion system secretin GspD [Aquabacterium sp.]|uniref:type II secretion system secretin GspD n=1 Tax=Aquabacterium sp. TaxID=1872578 RepID=UPI0035B3CE8F
MMTHPQIPSRALALVTALALCLGPGGLLPASMGGAALAAGVKKGEAAVTLNFVNAEIEGVARAMAAIVGHQIMVDPRVKGNITLYSEQPLTPREAYLNFLAALRGQGYTVVETGGLLKVVPEAEAKLQTGTVEVGAVKRSGDQVITQIFRLQHENANNLVPVLRPLISPNNTINANAASNTLVITDYADNLKRIGQMIAAMDVPAATDMEAMPLQYAVAADLAPIVQKLADGGGTATAPGAAATGQTTMVLPDSRTNTLLVKAPNPARLALVRTLIQRLDKPGTSGLGGSGIHVVYLRNADAVRLAQVLRAAYPNAGNGGTATQGSGTPSQSGNQPSQNNLSSSSSSSSSSSTSTQSTTPVTAAAQPNTGGYIQADPSTNSLIITATDAVYRQLRAVIDQLDGRRAQIYIEAMVVEVNAEKAAQFGIQWAGALGNTGSSNLLALGTSLTAGTIPSIVSVASDATTALASAGGLNIGTVHKYSNGTYGLSSLATFLQTNADGNVLSTPNLITLDNEEAKIVVGKNVPFVTGTYTTTTTSSGTVSPFQTVDRKDVGLTLRVRPQVGEGGTVRMTVYQEKSDIQSGTETNTNGPTTVKSSIETTVVVDDGQVMVLGGLLEDSYSLDNSQVPGLGDLPWIGNLFKAQSRTRKKTNLMVFLRPIVMRTQEASNTMTMDRYEYMRQRQVESKPTESSLLPINEVPQMDPLKLSNSIKMPSVNQPLDDPQATPPTVVMPGNSGYVPKLAPATTTP